MRNPKYKSRLGFCEETGLKLPRSTTRRYRVLRAFIGRAMSVDDVIAVFGLFGFEWKSALAEELKLLRRGGYMRLKGEKYVLNPDVEKELCMAGEGKIEVVPPRSYNVYTQPELGKKYWLDSRPRRPNALDVRVSRHYTASDPIPFNEEEQ